MKRVLLNASCLLILFTFYVDSNAFQSLMPEDMYECCQKLLCPLNRAEDFYKLVEELSPELKEKTWEWIKSSFGIEGPDNTLENWFAVKAVNCDLPEDKKRKQFNEFFQLGGEYWLDVCINIFSERCKKAVEAAAIVTDYYEGQFVNGNCEKSGGTDPKRNKRPMFG
ncbi:uncharacterized protein LOC129961769 [Argiope bruennichi]|uniref:uncharacterized protein LOC129961769 n=1 Tax=Argiope bruennichi TaxID=94029 RepID=UPI002494BD84|nr:uncharacterized protein LOC129961769 [Argiope bruennichi]XP_055931307.1 uncharacterized protein LOC129961769 [Argiope bruennichi]